MELTDREKIIAIECYTIGFQQAAMQDGTKVYHDARKKAEEFVTQKGRHIAYAADHTMENR